LPRRSACWSRPNNRWQTDDALRRFADDLDSADADGAVRRLPLAANRGANGASATLHALADSIQAQLKGRRVIVERGEAVRRRASGDRDQHATSPVFVDPAYFEPYRSPLGQAMLSVLVCLYLSADLADDDRQRPRLRVLIRQPR
jgi:hypothetical protein